MAESSTKVTIFRTNREVVYETYLGYGAFLIGREDECAIRIGDDDSYVSRKHALLIISEEKIEIEDLGSTSGTYLDGIPVKGRVVILPGMKVYISNLKLDIQKFGVNELVAGIRLGSGRYSLIKRVGRGGLGDVWKAYDEDEGKRLALKLIHSAMDLEGNGARDLQREVDRLNNLDHPNIIRVGYFWRLKDEPPFITMEYVEGKDLEKRRTDFPNGLLPWKSVQHYMIQLCKALRYAHGHHLAHRDIKPSNMLIDSMDNLKLADFGFAASLSKSSRMSSAIVFGGTPYYCGPQQLKGEPPQATDDIYSVGATIYDLLTGTPPFYEGDVYRNVIHVPAKPMEKRLREIGQENSIPDYVAAMVMACLQKDPDKRPQNARVLQQWIQSEGHDVMLEAEPIQLWGPRPDKDSPRETKTIEANVSTKKTIWGRLSSWVEYFKPPSHTIGKPYPREPLVRINTVLPYSVIGLCVVCVAYYLLPSTSPTKSTPKPTPQDKKGLRIAFRGFTRAPAFTSTPPKPDNGVMRVAIRGLNRRTYNIKGKPEFSVGTCLWEFESEGQMASSPAIANNTIYVGSNDNFVYSLDSKSGAEKSYYLSGGDVISSPSISVNNIMYFGTFGGKICALNANTGAKLWEFETKSSVLSSPAIGTNNLIYIGSWDKHIYAIDANTGVSVWSFLTEGEIEGMPSIGLDGTVYFGSLDKNVYALDGETGKKKWEFVTEGKVRSSAAIGGNGNIYIGSDDNKVYAINAEKGTEIWSFITGGGVSSSVAIGPKDAVYAGSDDGNIYAIDGVDGKLKWSFNTGDQVKSSPAIGDDGTVYVGSSDRTLYALNAEDGRKSWVFQTKGEIVSSPSIGPHGILYIASYDKKVYAIKTASKGLAESPWPMRGQNARHTGRAMK